MIITTFCDESYVNLLYTFFLNGIQWALCWVEVKRMEEVKHCGLALDHFVWVTQTLVLWNTDSWSDNHEDN